MVPWFVSWFMCLMLFRNFNSSFIPSQLLSSHSASHSLEIMLLHWSYESKCVGCAVWSPLGRWTHHWIFLIEAYVSWDIHWLTGFARISWLNTAESTVIYHWFFAMRSWVRHCMPWPPFLAKVFRLEGARIGLTTERRSHQRSPLSLLRFLLFAWFFPQVC